MSGAIALVGSGEYLPIMQPFESELIQMGMDSGKSAKFIQLATAAGKEGFASLQRWRELGEKQADRIGVEAVFVEAFNRDDAHDPNIYNQVEDAALIYLSGGDPIYLTQTLSDTPLLDRIRNCWLNGSSVAGCSAGAMALAAEVANPFKLTSASTIGLNFVPNLKVLPHFDRYFGWIPSPMAKYLGRSGPGILPIGIDENTAILSTVNLNNWDVWGFGSVQLLKDSESKFKSGDKLVLSELSTEH